jgi:putative cardiolipin synthase
VFYGSILEAADKGVKVELLFDGIFHNLKGKEKITYRSLISHPNIRIRFFEPLNILKPWTFNNRLHDKFVIIDDKYLLLGGRNIGDKYYLENYDESIVEDRDILIINTDSNNVSESVIHQFNNYFDSLWNHKYTKEKVIKIAKRQKPAIDKNQQKILTYLEEIREQYPDKFDLDFDWLEHSLPTNKITLITNPIDRFNKEPTILAQIGSLTNLSKERILFQSPYIIFNKHMSKYFSNNFNSAKLFLLTNSAYSSPNYFAVSGYLKNRAKLAMRAENLYEYYGEGSIHAKTYVFDNKLSMMGSFNLDPRSSFLSTESIIVIDSEEVAEALTQKIELIINQSISYSADSQTPKQITWYKKLLITIVRILFYPFDFLL